MSRAASVVPRVRIHGDLARACPAAAPDGAGLTHVTVQVQRKDTSVAAAEPAVEEMAIEALFNAIAPLIVVWDTQALGSTPPGDLEDLQFLGQGAQAFWPSADCGDAEFQAAATAEQGIWVQKLLAVMGQVGLIAGQYAGPQWRPGNRPPSLLELASHLVGLQTGIDQFLRSIGEQSDIRLHPPARSAGDTVTGESGPRAVGPG